MSEVVSEVRGFLVPEPASDTDSDTNSCPNSCPCPPISDLSYDRWSYQSIRKEEISLPSDISYFSDSTKLLADGWLLWYLKGHIAPKNFLRAHRNSVNNSDDISKFIFKIWKAWSELWLHSATSKLPSRRHFLMTKLSRSLKQKAKTNFISNKFKLILHSWFSVGYHSLTFKSLSQSRKEK